MDLPEELADDEERRRAYSYLLGQYLGDGCIAMHGRDVARLRIICADDWPLVMDRVVRSMAAVLPTNVVGYVSGITVADGGGVPGAGFEPARP